MTDAEMMQAARYAAEAIVRKWPRLYEREDVEQEAALWLVEHPERVERARLDSGELYIPQVVAEVLKPLARQAKKDRAKALGVSTRYQSTYTREQVEVILASAWSEADEHPVIVQENETGITAKTDPAYGGNFPVQVLDVRRAMARTCSVEEQRCLFVRYMMGETGRAAAHHALVSRHD